MMLICGVCPRTIGRVFILFLGSAKTHHDVRTQVCYRVHDKKDPPSTCICRFEAMGADCIGVLRRNLARSLGRWS